MNTKKFLTLLLVICMMLALAACGSDAGKSDGKPKNAEEAVSMYQDLMAQETEILTENSELWEKVFMQADKGMAMVEDGKNYGEFLLATIETISDQFTEDELKLLREGAEKVSDIEKKLTAIEEQYPDEIQKLMDGGMSMPADADGKQVFPSFTGKDLDGNEVKSDELFSAHAFTVVNFWFTTCSPCVGELSDLDSLNQEFSKKDGAVIGVNSFTLDGNQTAIDEAKAVLQKKGATYQNIYFDSNSEAGKFVTNVYAFPTTYVVDRNGCVVGDPIVGAVTGDAQKKALEELIDKALEADVKK